MAMLPLSRNVPPGWVMLMLCMSGERHVLSNVLIALQLDCRAAGCVPAAAAGAAGWSG